MPKVGDPAPDFKLEDQNGESITLKGLRSKTVVLYFYPRADTPGCTREAICFKESINKFNESQTVVLGVSPDTVKSQLKFAMKFDLPFHLLADADHAVAEEYGVWKLKSMLGRKYMGVERQTFIIDRDGTVAHVFPKVRPDGHADEVLAAIRKAAGH